MSWIALPGLWENYRHSPGSGCLAWWSHPQHYSSMIHLQNYSSETFSSRTNAALVFSEFFLGRGVLFTLSRSVLTVLPLYLSSGISVRCLKVLVPDSSSFIWWKFRMKTAGPDPSWESGLYHNSSFWTFQWGIHCYSCCHCYVGHFSFGASWWDFIICGKQSY